MYDAYADGRVGILQPSDSGEVSAPGGALPSNWYKLKLLGIDGIFLFLVFFFVWILFFFPRF